MFRFNAYDLSANALDQLRDWDFSFSGIADYLGGLAMHHIVNNGIWGFITIVVITLALLIAFPPTRYLGSQLSSNLIQSAFSLLNLVVMGTGLLILAGTSKMGKGAVRNFGRTLVDWAKKRK